MIIDCISDLHGHYPKLDGGDLLIVAGDLTAKDTSEQFHEFWRWTGDLPYEKIVVIAGNHDNFLVKNPEFLIRASVNMKYLCDSGTEFGGLKIWGAPWIKSFPGINPKCKAFTVDTEEELAKKWALIPDDVDILITHSPPMGVLDSNLKGEKCGSRSLLNISMKFKNLKLFVFGHIHESYGHIAPNYLESIADILPTGHVKCLSFPHLVNSSHVNERYEPINKPIRVIL